MKYLIIAAIWLSVGYINAGFVLAENQAFWANFLNKGNFYKREHYRRDLSFAVGWSMLPFAPLLTPFMTGFYEHGWMEPTLDVNYHYPKEK